MTQAVKRHSGVVNQFVGDEVFAIFGAPISANNNEQNAVFCAIEMMEKLVLLIEQFGQVLKTPLKIGIGINSGEVVAGNMGSEDKIEYSVTGDTVNTGKRIETLTQDAPNRILISEGVFEKVKDLVEWTAWEPVMVKGKKEKLLVFEVLKRKA